VAEPRPPEAPRQEKEEVAALVHEEEKPIEFAGGVEAVAEDGKSMTVVRRERDRSGEVKRTEVKIGERTRVIYQLVGPNGARPTRGYSVQVRLAKSSGDEAASLSFHGTADPFRRRPDVTARVVAVSRDGKSFSADVGGRGRASLIDVSLGERTVVSFQNVRPGGASISPGYQAGIWWQAGSTKSAARAQFRGAATVERRRDDARGVTGKVVAAARDGKSFSLQLDATRGEEARKVAVLLDERTTVAFHNVPPDGARVAVGLMARAWLKEGSKDSAERVVFSGAVRERVHLLGGKVVAVSLDGKMVSLELLQRGTLERDGRGVRREGPLNMDVRISDRTRVGYSGVGPGEATPACGFYAQVLLADASRDTAAGIMFVKPGSGQRR
jgi:hypothetical protein